MNKLHKIVSGLLFGLLLPAGAAIISINIDENQSSRRAMVPADLAGANVDVRVANWNNIPATLGTSSYLGADLVFDNGTTVGGTFEVEYISPRSTSLTVTTLSNDAQMYSGLQELRNGETLTVNLKNIPFAQYEIYIYTNGGVANRGGSIALGGNTTYYNKFGSPASDDGTGYVQITSTVYDSLNPGVGVGSGNFVRYETLSGANQTFTLSALNMGDATNHRHRLMGFQIVQIPEPGTLTLSFTALLMGLVLRRRR